MASKYLVYRNLHKKCWSIKKDGKVISRKQWFLFSGPNGTAGFMVSEPGRQRVLKEKRKNVHAFGWGWYPSFDEKAIEDWFNSSDPSKLTHVSYNPYKAGTFVETASGKPIHEAEVVYFTPTGVWVEK